MAASITTVGGGILSNRADAAFLWGCQSLLAVLGQPTNVPMHEVLRKALHLSYLQALRSVCSECKADLVGEFGTKYRLLPTYPPEIKKDIRWLENQLKKIAAEIRAIEKGDLATVPDISLQAIASLEAQATQKPADKDQSARKRAARSLIESAAKPDAIALYSQKLHQTETGLFQRICGFFAQQLAKDSALQAFFETQLLIQINSGLSDQKITLESMQQTLDDLSQIVPQQMNEALSKLESIEVGQATIAERTDSILELSQEIRNLIVVPGGEGLLGQGGRGQGGEGAIAASVAEGEPIVPNPFGPLGGRIDSPEKFFGQEPLLKSIFERLNSGSSVALIGGREMGKSSLLKAVQYRAKDMLQDNRQPIYIDLKQVENEADFYFLLCDEIGIEEARGARLARALRPKRLLLLIDELEKMTWDGFTSQVRGQLRGLAEGRDAPLRLVMAATKSLDQLFPDSVEGNMVSPFSGICIEERVGLWRDEVVREFVCDRLSQTPIKFSEADIQEIIQKSQGQPREIVKLAYRYYGLYQGLKQ